MSEQGNRGRRINQDIPDGGAEVTLLLPSGAILTGVSVHARTAMPRTIVRLLADSTNSEVGAIYLKNGTIYTLGTTTFGLTWTGALTMDADYENKVRALIFNLTGATVKCSLSAYWRRTK